MDGYLLLGDRAALLGVHEGMAWVSVPVSDTSLTTRWRTVAVNLAAGRVLCEDVEWSRGSVAGPLLAREIDGYVRVRDVQGERWQVPGRLYATSPRWIVVVRDEALHVLDTEGEIQLVLPEQLGQTLVIADEIAIVGPDRVRVYDEHAQPAWELADLPEPTAWTVNGRIAVDLGMEYGQTRFRGALETVVPGFATAVVGGPDGWLVHSEHPGGHGVLQGVVRGRPIHRVLDRVGLIASPEGFGVVGFSEVIRLTHTTTTWSCGQLLEPDGAFWDGMLWVRVRGHGLAPVRPGTLAPIDVLGLGADAGPVDFTRNEG
ncbi:MAG: hypothetical protein H6734_15625 [Alphaproteobacteria bacterium]|nr:hypothetical protein [Alphaproteobacteria bacterium]